LKTKAEKAEYQKAWRNANPNYGKEWHAKNLDRVHAYQKAYRERHPGRQQDQRLRKVYGITREQYEIMGEAQDWRCAICRTDHPGGKIRKFHIDHDHATGRVRGLLCHFCNTKVVPVVESGLVDRARAYV
jgi:hypothetical protein